MIIYGKRSFEEFISKPSNLSNIKTIYVSKSFNIEFYINKFPSLDTLKIVIKSSGDLDKIAHKTICGNSKNSGKNSSNHQGVIIELYAHKEFLGEADLLNNIVTKNVSKICVLDSLTDIHNIGAIIRAAACFGYNTIILPRHKSVKNLSVLYKTSSGMVDNVDIYSVNNLNMTLDNLKQHEYWVIGLDMLSKNCDKPQYEISDDFLRSLDYKILVIGSEGKGMRPLVKQNCDFIGYIPIAEDSLNVSQATAIAMYELH